MKRSSGVVPMMFFLGFIVGAVFTMIALTIPPGH